MMTVNHEKYMCILPELTGKDDEVKLTFNIYMLYINKDLYSKNP